MEKQTNKTNAETLGVLEDQIQAAIPIARAQFHAAVNNGDGTPENYFSVDSTATSRRVEMYLAPNYLICLHKGKYIVVPLSNIIFANAK